MRQSCSVCQLNVNNVRCSSYQHHVHIPLL